jgi:hypothetical protein
VLLEPEAKLGLMAAPERKEIQAQQVAPGRRDPKALLVMLVKSLVKRWPIQLRLWTND